MHTRHLFVTIVVALVGFIFFSVAQAQETNGNMGTGGRAGAPGVSSNAVPYANNASFAAVATSESATERSNFKEAGSETNGEAKLPMTGTTDMRAENEMGNMGGANGGWTGQGLVFRKVKVEKETNLSVDNIVSQLGKAALLNGLTVVGYVNEDAAEQAGAPTLAAPNTIRAESVLVENPNDANKLLSEDPAAALILPARVTVFERNGHFMIAYIRPSEALKKFSHEDFPRIGAAMDSELSGMVRSVTE